MDNGYGHWIQNIFNQAWFMGHFLGYGNLIWYLKGYLLAVEMNTGKWLGQLWTCGWWMFFGAPKVWMLWRSQLNGRNGCSFFWSKNLRRIWGRSSLKSGTSRHAGIGKIWKWWLAASGKDSPKKGSHSSSFFGKNNIRKLAWEEPWFFQAIITSTIFWWWSFWCLAQHLQPRWPRQGVQKWV